MSQKQFLKTLKFFKLEKRQENWVIELREKEERVSK